MDPPREEAGAADESEGHESEALAVNKFILQFFTQHVQVHYLKDGKPTAEQDCFRSALRPLKKLYGSLPVDEFGPVKLKHVRSEYIQNGWSRKYVNKSVGRVRLMFRWGLACLDMHRGRRSVALACER